MPVVTHLEAVEILDSRGRPTVQASCILDGGVRASASVPSGATPGLIEALELRDGDVSRYRGLGCRKAVGHIEGEIRTALLNKRFADQTTLDRALLLLDGTEKKSRLGANAVLAVSVAFARAHAAIRGIPLYQHCADIMGHTLTRLPRPVINLFAGALPGESRGELRGVAIVPTAASVDEALATAHAVYQAGSALVVRKYKQRWTSAEDGSLAAPFIDDEDMLTDAVEAIRAAEREPGRDVLLALDVGAGRLYDSGWYRMDGEKLTAGELGDRLARWADRYPIASVIDPLGDEDWEHWAELSRRLGDRLGVLADDLFRTCPARVKRGIAGRAARGLVIKPNQVGTMTEAADIVRAARQAGWTVAAGTRSGETEDDWIADLAVGWASDQVHLGALTRSERLAKYNRLLAIEKRSRLPLPPPPAVAAPDAGAAPPA